MIYVNVHPSWQQGLKILKLNSFCLNIFLERDIKLESLFAPWGVDQMTFTDRGQVHVGDAPSISQP